MPTISGTLTAHPASCEVLVEAGVIVISSPPAPAAKRKQKDRCIHLTIDVEKALRLCAHSDDTPPPRRRAARALHVLFSALFGRSDEDDSSTGSRSSRAEMDADAVYQRLHSFVGTHDKRPSLPLHALPALRPTLRGYQRDAIEWMLARERHTIAALPPASEVLWRRLSCDDGTPVYWNTANGALIADAPVVPPPPPVYGGILADEMGLGKSVEVIGLLLANPKPSMAQVAAAVNDADGGAAMPLASDASATGARCAAGHPLVRSDCSSGLRCDMCGQVAAETDARFSCITCDYDLCTDCAATATGRGAAAAESLGDELPCICEGTPPGFDGTWVGCDGCGRWVHACCAGFTSAAEAEAVTDYRCLMCACSEGEKAPKACDATLLVCPAAILGQWQDEVARHVHEGGLRVCKYTGVRDAIHDGWKRPERLAALHPARLLSFDLVLTSFEVLRAELDHAPLGGDDASAGRTLRRPSAREHSAARLCSPLLSARWWRLVLDEAQMVESGTAKAAAMALRLQATHRWAVSGTPMGRGRLADLQGLMAFLQVELWSERSWWNYAIETPLSNGTPSREGEAEGARMLDGTESRLLVGTSYAAAEARLLSLLHVLMWRNSKLSVLSQLALPPLREQVHRLTFSSVERHFYDKQHRECIASAQKALSLLEQQQKLTAGPQTARANAAAAAADRARTSLSQHGVLRLRQACCHPQLGSFGIRRRGGAATLSNPLSMREILGKLIEEERSKCEEEQRKIVFNLCALGSMHAMIGRFAAAAASYGEGLSLIHANRRPTPLDSTIDASLIGPSSFEALKATEGTPQALLGPLRWTLATDFSDAATTTLKAEAPSAPEVWMRIELSKPRRLSEIRLRCESGLCATPAHCSLEATSGADTSGIFVTCCTFDVPPPRHAPALPLTAELMHTDGALSSGGSRCESSDDGWYCFGFYRPFKSKQYRLRIHSWHAPQGSSSGDASAAIEITGMRLMEAELEADALQLLHMMHNHTNNTRMGSLRGDDKAAAAGDAGSSMARLGDGLDIEGVGTIESTTSPDASAPRTAPERPTMVADAAQLQSQLVSERTAVAAAQRTQWSHLRDEVEQRLGDVSVHWLRRALDEVSAMPSQYDGLLRDKLVADASLSGSAAIACGGSAVAALRWAIEERAHSLRKRRALMEGLDGLAASPSEAEVRESGDCFKCRQDWGKKGELCRHCKLEAVYDSYFYSLFSHRRQRKVELLPSHNVAGDHSVDAGAAAGNTGEAFLEEAPLLRFLHALIGWIGSQAALSGGAHGGSGNSGGGGGTAWAALHEDAMREHEAIALLKREIRVSRSLWSAHFDLLSQLDELTTALTTMELVESPQQLAKIAPIEAERHRYVGRWEYEERADKYRNDLLLARDDLQSSQRQFSFLRQQALQHDALDSEVAQPNSECCPVCHEEMGRERTIPRCAHSLCMTCAESIMRRHAGRFVCPLCREASDQPATASELRLTDGSSKGTRVVGSWGTKVTAVVETVLGLPAADKCLIFSQWDDLLSLIARALSDNGVQYCRLQGRQTLDAELHSFRHTAQVRALLLPLRSGANGINLVEAQHVLLVEPLIETAVESQAIGRIHRMSQTRETAVHRFVVHSTIEEAILGLRGRHSSVEDGDAPAPNSPGKAASPSKRARKAEESKLLSWETVQALFSSTATEGISQGSLDQQS